MTRWVQDFSWADFSDSSPEHVPERSLWAAVIIHAESDIRIGDQEAIDEVFEWLDDPDFVRVCDLAGVPPDAVRRYFKSLQLKRQAQGKMTVTGKKNTQGRKPGEPRGVMPRHLYANRVHGVCIDCQKEFAPRRTDTVFCSQKCRTLAYRKRKKLESA